jgi:hypothetical protein
MDHHLIPLRKHRVTERLRALPLAPAKDREMSSAEDYLAKAAEALEKLRDEKSPSERSRLQRAHGAYLKLASHGAEAAARAAASPPKRIVPEKRPPEKVEPSYRRS